MFVGVLLRFLGFYQCRVRSFVSLCLGQFLLRFVYDKLLGFVALDLQFKTILFIKRKRHQDNTFYLLLLYYKTSLLCDIDVIFNFIYSDIKLYEYIYILSIRFVFFSTHHIQSTFCAFNVYLPRFHMWKWIRTLANWIHLLFFQSNEE